MVETQTQADGSLESDTVVHEGNGSFALTGLTWDEAEALSHYLSGLSNGQKITDAIDEHNAKVEMLQETKNDD